jgi:glycosyltransferase involved in cell wall biosynthesis
MFLPSHLECFSASYAEAMKMKRPILTSDLSFAHTVCGDAALYFNNNDPTDIAKKIKLIIEDKELYNKLVECGTERLKTFFDSKQQAMSYIKICNKIIEMSK